MNSKLLVDIQKESSEQPLIESSFQKQVIPTLTETIARENLTDSPESHWLKEAVLKEVVSRHRTTVQELAQLTIVLNRYHPDMNLFEVREKLSQKANLMVQACLDECIPSIEHHLRMLLERDLQKQIDTFLKTKDLFNG
jgi:hypothetical protein